MGRDERRGPDEIVPKFADRLKSKEGFDREPFENFYDDING